MENNYRYTVATLCWTYNHAKYIKDTLNGFVIQRTEFPVVYIIVDDASTDGEQDVLREWAETNLNLQNNEIARIIDANYGQLIYARHKNSNNSYFVILLLSENHYQRGKDKRKSEYVAEWQNNARFIAICEGDDYWIDPLKLQKQVDVLEANDNIGLVYGKAKQWFEKEKSFGQSIGHELKYKEDIIYYNSVPTLTVLYRPELTDGLNKLIDPKWKMGDYPLWIWLVYHSSCYYINEDLGVYRILEESASHHKDLSKRLDFQNSIYDIQLFFSDYFKSGDKKRLLNNHISTLFDLCFIHKDVEKMNYYYHNLPKKSMKQRIKMTIFKNEILLDLYNLIQR